MKIRIPFEIVDEFLDTFQTTTQDGNQIVVVKKKPIVFQISAGARHFHEIKTPFVLKGGFKKETYQKLRGLGFLFFRVVEGEGIPYKPTNNDDYEYTLLYVEKDLSHRSFSSEIHILNIEGRVIGEGNAGTRIYSCAHFLVLLSKRGSLEYEYLTAIYNTSKHEFLKKVLRDTEKEVKEYEKAEWEALHTNESEII